MLVTHDMIWYLTVMILQERSALQGPGGVQSSVAALLCTPVDSVPDRPPVRRTVSPLLSSPLLSPRNVSLVQFPSLSDWSVSSEQSLCPLRPMSNIDSHGRVWLGPGESHDVSDLEPGAVSQQYFSFPPDCGTSRKSLTPSPPVWHTSSRQTTSASNLLSR